MMRWLDAKAYAEKLGGYLVVVTSEEENQFVSDLVRSKNMYQAFWIGLTDEAEEGRWKWVNGEPFEYSSWESGEPNGGRGENYVNMGHVNPTKWNDANTWARHPFVVEFNSVKDVKDLPSKCDCRAGVEPSSVEYDETFSFSFDSLADEHRNGTRNRAHCDHQESG